MSFAITQSHESKKIAFPEEPLSRQASSGDGYFPGAIGLKLDNGRFEIMRKLGWGRYSSTWLATDNQLEGRFYAIKILTAWATQANEMGNMQELKVLQVIANSNDARKLTKLCHHFTLRGPHGNHTCLVLRLLSTDTDSFRRASINKALTPPTVKVIVGDTLTGLRQLHALGIAHTAITANDFLFTNVFPKESIQEMLQMNPSVPVGSFKLVGERYPILRSQSIDHSGKHGDPQVLVALYSFILSDFSNARFLDRFVASDVKTTSAFCAPEVILQAHVDEKVDIWAFGCVVFELLTGKSLYNPAAGADQWSYDEDHLAQMLKFGDGQRFYECLWGTAKAYGSYFDSKGNLKHVSDTVPVDIATAIANYNVVPVDQIASAASFIKACLRFDPKDRPSARQLSSHEWIRDAGASPDAEFHHVTKPPHVPWQMRDREGAPQGMLAQRV